MPSEPKQICYNSYRYTKDSEPPKERIVEARVLDFGHRDDGSIEVTFEGEPFDGVNMCVYTIRFEGIDGYAMAAAIPADNGVEVEDVDYEAEAEEAADSYESSFSEYEIALPKGTYVNNGELYVTDAAPQIVQEVLVESGIAEESVSRAITPGEGDVGEAGVDAAPFDGFDVYMNNVISEFIHVAGDVSQSAEFNPVICYDKYWNMYFNFDTRGYYLRQSFRSGIEFELKRAFGLIEIYHNIFSPKTRGVYADTYNKLFISAIEQLNSMPAGTSPEEVSGGGMRYFDYLKPVHCNTFNKDIRSMTWGCCAIGNYVPTGMIEEYQRRLHGRTVDEDLKLASMISTKYQNYNSSYTAVGFNGRKEGKQYFADVIKQNGKIIYKDYISSYGKENKREFINYYYHWFIFAGDPNQQYYWP